MKVYVHRHRIKENLLSSLKICKATSTKTAITQNSRIDFLSKFLVHQMVNVLYISLNFMSIGNFKSCKTYREN